MSKHRHRPDILIVSAHLPELTGLRSLLGESLHANVGGLEVAATAVGIGIAAAAAGTAFELVQREPRAVVLVGTAGAYRGHGLSIGQVVVGRRVHLGSAALPARKGAFPPAMPVMAETTSELRAGLAHGASGDLHEVDIATTLAITTDDALAAALSQSVNADVEHLEAFGVSAACSARAIPWGVALGIANFVGADAREEWRAHHETSGHAASAAVAAWVAGGAVGLKTSR